ncbi:MAG TPA: glycerophosphodiester phosphodiesterase [Thermomicrobiales bacterium]|nr:glycerophosphodiester phosphodiesterase [Thermomicrobiales bacterium]
MKPRWRALAAVALAIVTAVAWLWSVILRDLTQRYTRGERPGQFPGDLDADLLDDYGNVFVIAHNAGDHAETAQTALDHGADAVEIDVIMVGETLYATHAVPPKLIGAWLFRGPRLADAWEIVRHADAVALDLKDSSTAYEDALVTFLSERPHDQVVLSSRSIESLIRLGQRLPNAHLYLSVPNREFFDAVSATSAAFVDRLDGVSMQHSQIDADMMATLKRRDQRMIAWTVNDLTRVNELVRLGVDGITSDNLAILELLGGRERPEPLLRRRTIDQS